MSKKNKVNPKVLTAQEFINVEDVSDGLLYTKDGFVFGYINVHAGDSRLLSDVERIRLAQRLTFALTAADDKPVQILSLPRTVDIMGIIDSINERRKLTRNDAKLKLLNGEITSLQELQREGAKEPVITIICWEKAARGADDVLKKRMKEICYRLSEAQVAATILNDQDITYLCKVFADLEVCQDKESEIEDVPMLSGSRRRVTRKHDDASDQDALRSLITPVGGIQFGVSRVTVGSVSARIYGAMRYPSELDYGWAIDLMNSSTCITSITYYPGNVTELGDALARSIKKSNVDAETEGNARLRKHYEKEAADADRLIEALDFKSSPIGHIAILVMPFTDREEDLEDVCRAVNTRFASKRIKLRPLGNMQKDAYKMLSPYYTDQPVVNDVLKRICPLESLMGGFPLTVNQFRDDNGSYFARTMDGGIMSIDLLMRGRDRTNSNAVFTGAPGQGKSTAVKHLVETVYMNGVKVIIIDPEREFRDLCINLGGTWLDVGGGAAKVNPFQVRPVPLDEEEDIANALYRANDNALALHIHTLDVFFSLYLPSLTDYQRALLKKSITEAYSNKGISWDTDVTVIPPEAFPVAQDVYNVLAAHDEPEYKELAALLYDMAQGADSFLWNGYTNVDMTSDFVVMDTRQLVNSSNEVKRAQYFNALTLCWQIMSENREQPVLLVCDEGHIIFDPEIPQTSMYMRNYAKRARKYEAGLWLVTQSLVDLLNEKVKLSGQAVLDCATYKVFFGTDGKNLEETAELFKLTESEKNVLLSQQRGHALLLLGKQHVHVDFDIPMYKLELMGKGGGR